MRACFPFSFTRPLCRPAALLCGRTFLSTTPLSRCSAASDVLEVELLMPDDDPIDAAAPPDTAAAETIAVIDPFARAKVSNFARRLSPTAVGAGHEVREVQSDGDATLFHARLRLPLPAAYGERWGEGLASTAKEAELVAAMHAERVIDALGLPMFALVSKQRRHAEAARAAGRWAPMPDESPRPPSTPSPPRLQYVAEGAARATERRLQIDKMHFAPVSSGAFTPMRLTLASPFFLDHGSVSRIRQFFAAYDCTVQRYSRVTALHKCGNVDKGSPVEEADKMFVAQLKLPIDARFGERIACGKAPTRREAIALACMHAELIIDALGLALYPSNREQQTAHAEECRRVNRWCAEPGDCEYHYNRPSPPPLQLVQNATPPAAVANATFTAIRNSSNSNSSSSGGGGGDNMTSVNSLTTGLAGANTTGNSTTNNMTSSTEGTNLATSNIPTGGVSLEALLLSHTAAIESYTNVVEVRTLLCTTKGELEKYLEDHQSGGVSPFFVESLGVKGHYTYRASATIPVPPVSLSKSTESASPKASSPPVTARTTITTTVASHDEPLPSFVAIGIGLTEMAAKVAAAMHALRVLSALRRHGNADEAPLNLFHHTPLPPPVRHVVGHVGRVMVPGLHPAAVGRRPGLEEDAHAAELRLRAARAELSASDWSLEPDAEHRIIVDPTASTQEGRNYVHTLPAVRRPDRFATVRLRDYLERHGKRLDSSIAVQSSLTDEGLQRWTAQVALPVPEAFGKLVAQGEAYEEEDAVVMCAVHAELLLDELGIALYDHAVLQRKHCEAARLLGRWTPRECSESKPRVSHDRLPPPVRKEHCDSCLWARLAKTRAVAEAKTISSSTPTPTAVEVSTNANATPTRSTSEAGVVAGSTSTPVTKGAPRHMHTENNDNNSHTRHTGGSSGNDEKGHKGTKSGDRNCAESGTLTDDVLCDLEHLTAVHPSEFFRNAPRLLEQYCRRQGADLSLLMRQYSVSTLSRGGLLHRAVLELPVPHMFGRRYAVACAATKKEAFALCCMHGTRLLDTLGIPLYVGYKQAEYAAMCSARGRYAPRPGDPPRPPDTPSPPGLKHLPDETEDAPPPPPPPPPADTRLCTSIVWAAYIQSCRGYIQRIAEYTRNEALFRRHRAPRSGVEIEDKGLDAMEALPLVPHAKSTLPKRCAAAGIPPPPMFRYEMYGRVPHRRFLVEQPVLGTPFVARGAGEEGHEAVTRAAMHYEYIIGIVSAAQQESQSSHSSPSLRQRPTDLFDPALRDFTPRGKLAIMALYAASHAPFAPLRLTLKERRDASSTTSSNPTIVALVELEDESGLRMAGKGETRGNVPDEARDRAVAELYRQLQRKSAFQSMAQLALTHPNLRGEAAAWPTSEIALRRLMEEALSITSVTIAEPDWGDGKGVAALLHDRANTPASTMNHAPAASTTSTATARSASSFSSSLPSWTEVSEAPERRLLVEAATTTLGASKRPVPLTAPSAARQLLRTMGLAGDGLHATPVGVATALLVTCLPPQSVCNSKTSKKSWNHNNHTIGIMQLQLAKLLCLGYLLHCPRLAVRAVALALAAANGDGEISFILSDAPLHGAAAEVAAEISHRLRDLSTHLTETSPASPLSKLLTSVPNGVTNSKHLSPTPTATALTGGAENGAGTDARVEEEEEEGDAIGALSALDSGRLRLAVASAVFPRVMVQRRAATNAVLRRVTVETRDQQWSQCVPIPIDVLEEATPRGDTWHAACPCFCPLDCTERTESAALGVFLPPCGVLLASALSLEPQAVCVADDVPNVAVVDGFVPVVMRAPESLAALMELRLKVWECWSALRPLPPPLQSALDELMGARHSLQHIAQASLLQ